MSRSDRNLNPMRFNTQRGAVHVVVLLVMTAVIIAGFLIYVYIIIPNQVITRNRFTNAPLTVKSGQAVTFLYVIERKKRKNPTWTRLPGQATTFDVAPRANVRIIMVNGVGQGTQDPVTGKWTGATSATGTTDANGSVPITIVTDHLGLALLGGKDVARSIREIHDFRSTP